MVMGQSAATAAALAIDQGTSLQELKYADLKERLLSDGTVLDFESPPIVDKPTLSKQALGGIVVDDDEAQLVGFDKGGTTAPGYVGAGYRHDGNADKECKPLDSCQHYQPMATIELASPMGP